MVGVELLMWGGSRRKGVFDGDYIQSGIVVGKLEEEREITLGFVDLLRNDYIIE